MAGDHRIFAESPAALGEREEVVREALSGQERGADSHNATAQPFDRFVFAPAEGHWNALSIWRELSRAVSPRYAEFRSSWFASRRQVRSVDRSESYRSGDCSYWSIVAFQWAHKFLDDVRARQAQVVVEIEQYFAVGNRTAAEPPLIGEIGVVRWEITGAQV